MSSKISSWKIEGKDCIYLFIISIFLQFIIYYFSFIYGNSVKALGYISFAGTLISIILAVIAIGYTYGESIKQKTSSDQLLVEIAGLRDIKDKLEGQIGILENIADLKNKVEDTKDAVSKLDVSKQLDLLRLQFEETRITDIPTNMGLQYVEQVIMNLKPVTDGFILEIMGIIQDGLVESLEDIPKILTVEDENSNTWLTVANLNLGVYFFAESVGIFSNLKIKDGVRKIYLKKYTLDSEFLKRDSHFSRLLKRVLY